MRHTERNLDKKRILYFQLKIVHTLVRRTDLKSAGVDVENTFEKLLTVEKVEVGEGASDGNKEKWTMF